MEARDILDLVFGAIGFLGVIISMIFYYRERLRVKDLENERKSFEGLRKIFHWQLQAIHHECNRIEHIMLDETRPDLAVIEVARGIRDSVDALMGQLLNDVYVFPWANVPIRDPKTEEEIGRMIGGEHHYKVDYGKTFPYVELGSYKEQSEESTLSS